ncbi:MAG TPA: ABC transporter ATP-binding protein [Clostridiales bacterium]|nr:ABC transporter ATP-binding protein [Clostridiales bacterium]
MNKVKRISALIGIIFIAAMYILFFISAFFATEYSNGLFLACLFSTIVIPIILWFFQVFYKLAHKKDDDNDPGNKEA